ncbi:hypothetical protein [Streptomyces sp. NBC_01803]|uniref:hypothetical protein n=1 Tax=Streptomyces sp. NBC_01803 TaxID=2975946 RepID=UPI002DDC87A6|nr:hypothetical protein [Streptomyces sp. NBC_01803]WSA45564.1 hypothetical protein OIE51_15970 [Streptomyces sp. NBC_01803]
MPAAWPRSSGTNASAGRRPIRTASRSAASRAVRPASVGRVASTSRYQRPTGAFFEVPARRHGPEDDAPVGDAGRRVVLVVRPERVTFP